MCAYSGTYSGISIHTLAHSDTHGGIHDATSANLYVHVYIHTLMIAYIDARIDTQTRMHMPTYTDRDAHNHTKHIIHTTSGHLACVTYTQPIYGCVRIHVGTYAHALTHSQT